MKKFRTQSGRAGYILHSYNFFSATSYLRLTLLSGCVPFPTSICVYPCTTWHWHGAGRKVSGPRDYPYLNPYVIRKALSLQHTYSKIIEALWFFNM